MIASLGAALVELVLPLTCVSCGSPGSSLCPVCRPRGSALLEVAGIPTGYCGEYTGALRTAVLAYKERGRRDLRRPLADLLAAAVRTLLDAAGVHSAVLVPVPSSPAAVRERGFAHVSQLARRVRTLTGCPTLPLLRLTRAVADSAGLSVHARAANLDGAMRAVPPPGRACAAVVLDDVTTTGATLQEAARALADAGWPVAGAAVLAATPRRYPRGAA